MLSNKNENQVKINFIDINEKKYSILVEIGKNILLEAQEKGVPIHGRCGAKLSCSTCHVYVEEEFFLKSESLQDLSDQELDILENTDSIEYNSRLCCQIFATKDMDEIVFTIEESSFFER